MLMLIDTTVNTLLFNKLSITKRRGSKENCKEFLRNITTVSAQNVLAVLMISSNKTRCFWKFNN